MRGQEERCLVQEFACWVEQVCRRDEKMYPCRQKPPNKFWLATWSRDPHLQCIANGTHHSSSTEFKQVISNVHFQTTKGIVCGGLQEGWMGTSKISNLKQVGPLCACSLHHCCLPERMQQKSSTQTHLASCTSGFVTVAHSWFEDKHWTALTPKTMDCYISPLTKGRVNRKQLQMFHQLSSK